MKKLKAAVVALAMLLSATLAQAENLKVGIINVQEILAKSPEAQQIREKLQNEFKGREAELVKVDKTLKANSEKLQRDGAVMSEAERSKLERETANAQRELQRLQTAFREDVTVRQQEEMQKYLDKVRSAVNKFAQDQKYDLLIHSDAAPYLNQKMDVTKQVIEALKKPA
ncbi:MAG TPA: OmpH family outer membrane protein [Gammaproteobacteria bacterium]|nr:OmpH family outer membrane protein [Gammaproteobacteria bacterium]